MDGAGCPLVMREEPERGHGASGRYWVVAVGLTGGGDSARTGWAAAAGLTGWGDLAAAGVSCGDGADQWRRCGGDGQSYGGGAGRWRRCVWWWESWAVSRDRLLFVFSIKGTGTGWFLRFGGISGFRILGVYSLFENELVQVPFPTKHWNMSQVRNEPVTFHVMPKPNTPLHSN